MPRLWSSWPGQPERWLRQHVFSGSTGYDGLLPDGRPTIEQTEIAQAADTKLRLGTVNSKGKQKGVDSLIVTDLIDLARNQAISDALIVAGDEDIRVGVQVAQTFGVRIHLLGIKPARGTQSADLIQEADTHHEWTDDVVSSWMTVQALSASPDPAISPSSRAKETPLPQSSIFDANAEAESKLTIGTLEASDLASAVNYSDANGDQIPSKIDRQTLARLRNRLKRTLSNDERKRYRTIFVSELRAAHAAAKA